jgi:hypothetical protein
MELAKDKFKLTVGSKCLGEYVLLETNICLKGKGIILKRRGHPH